MPDEVYRCGFQRQRRLGHVKFGTAAFGYLLRYHGNQVRARNVGLIDEIIPIWLKAWAFAFAIALPAIIIVMPLVRKFVLIVVAEE